MMVLGCTCRVFPRSSVRGSARPDDVEGAASCMGTATYHVELRPMAVICYDLLWMLPPKMGGLQMKGKSECALD